MYNRALDKKKMIPRTSAGLLIVLFVIVFMGVPSIAKDLRVLDIAWLTNNGTVPVDLASYTSSLWIPLAIKHFNERSNEVLPLTSIVAASCTAKLTLVDGVHDDEQSPKKAMQEFMARSADADILLGPVLSLTGVPVAVAAAAVDMPQLSFSASADQLSDKVLYPTFFRVGPTDAQSGQATAALFEQFGYKRVGIIAVNNDFGLAIKSALLQDCRRRGIEVFAQEYENSIGDKLHEQALAALQNIKRLRLNIVVYSATRFEFIYALAKAAKKLNWSIKGKLIVNHVALSDFSGLDLDQIKEAYSFLNGSIHIQSNVDTTNPGFLNMLRVWPTFNLSLIHI